MPVMAPPYPMSPVITGMEWESAEVIVRLAAGRGGDGSDLWPMTWADDGDLYTAYGDGYGFDPPVPEKLGLGFAKVSGDPAHVVGVNIGSEGENAGMGPAGVKASGLLMVDGVLYMWVRNVGAPQLAFSTDHARTWTWVDWRLTPGFGAPTFLNFGRNYAGARDEYVYVYSHDHDSAYETSDRMVLARVPADRITERDEYEFFAGLRDGDETTFISGLHQAGTPRWSASITDRQAVFANPGRCYRSGITYNPGLGRYLWYQVIPDPTCGGTRDSRFAGGCGVFDAPEPWGPWTTVWYTRRWNVGPGEAGCFPTKWMSPDGTQCHLVFSGDDRFSVRKASLLRRDPETRVEHRKRVGGRAVVGSDQGFGWERVAPSDVGMDANRLQATCEDLAERRTRGFLVIRGDRIVWEWYARGHGRYRCHYTASLAKALVGGITSLLAQTDGLVTPDDLACRYIDSWRDDPVRSTITIRHLATHSSGIADAEQDNLPHNKLSGWKGAFWARQPDPFTIAINDAPVLFEPGTRCAYSNPGMAALAWVVTAAYRGSEHPDLRTLLRERIMRPIGVCDDDWSIGYGTTYNVFGLPLVANWGGGNFTARAVARIGRLMLRRGDWDGQQLLDADRIEQALLHSDIPVPDRSVEGPRGVPGLCWWLNTDGAWPDLPSDAFVGAGAGQQVLLVVPSLNLIAVRQGEQMRSTATPGRVRADTVDHFLTPVVAATR